MVCEGVHRQRLQNLALQLKNSIPWWRSASNALCCSQNCLHFADWYATLRRLVVSSEKTSDVFLQLGSSIRPFVCSSLNFSVCECGQFLRNEERLRCHPPPPPSHEIPGVPRDLNTGPGLQSAVVRWHYPRFLGSQTARVCGDRRSRSRSRSSKRHRRKESRRSRSRSPSADRPGRCVPPIGFRASGLAQPRSSPQFCLIVSACVAR